MTSISSHKKSRAIYLDGRTLEGGGQLVRIALALSTITRHPITIDHIRGNRSGKQGLKGSHLAAIEYLADVSGSYVAGAKIGSTSLTFRPPRTPHAPANTDIDIRLPTAGAIFLVFQALYPYLLYTGGLVGDETSQGQAQPQPKPKPKPIRMSIVGGTNVSFAPSYDYVSQVLVPNFARVGLPPLVVQLDQRGWSSGPFELGKASFVIEPIRTRSTETRYGFPAVDLARHRRGRVTQIDITVLAPDSPVSVASASKDGQEAHLNMENEEPTTARAKEDGGNEATIRHFIEDEIVRLLRARLGKLPSAIFKKNKPDTPDSLPGLVPPDDTLTPDPVPITIHTSEGTHHHSHLYLLIVAHTSRGFKLGRDALYGGQTRAPRRKHGAPKADARSIAMELAERCVEDFAQELHDSRLPNPGRGRQPCVDEFMRDQMVIFEALGSSRAGREVERHERGEDHRYHSLHTQTARWVCEEMLDVEWNAS